VIGFDSALVRAEKPSFEQCSNPVNPGQGDMRRIAALGDDGSVMEKAMTGKIIVTTPTIGQHRCPRLNDTTDEGD
jgi:hypothetical protein